MRSAIVANGGLHGVSVIHCEPVETSNLDSLPKWEGVSAINDIVFKDEEMMVWRAYNVGNGKSIPYSELDLPDSSKLPELSKIKDADPSPAFFGVKARRSSKDQSPETQASTADSDDTVYEALFTCPEEGCIKAYHKYSYLERHLDFGKHQYSVERESFLDKAMVKYAEKLESGEIGRASCRERV